MIKGAAGVLGIAAFILAGPASAQTTVGAAPSTVAAARPARVPPIVSPEVRADGRVTFRLRAPGATDVGVVGPTNAGYVQLATTILQMAKDADGVWSATTASALSPDLYVYGFIVDGAHVPDPANLVDSWAGSGSGAAAATTALMIPGKPWSNQDVTHGTVNRVVYKSPIIGGAEKYYVYTPPGYDPKRKKPYPVLVVLGGLGAEAQDWIVVGGANLALDTLIGEGKAEPMILVSPTPYGNTGGNRAAAAGFPNFTKALIEEIMPRVEKEYNASRASGDHAITGMSAGGAQSLLLLNRLDQFQWIGSVGPGFDMYNPGWGTSAVGPTVNGQRPVLPADTLDNTFPKIDASENGKIRLLYVTCGTADDHLNLTRQFKSFFDAKGVKAIYVEPEGYEHAAPEMREHLVAFASRLFKLQSK